MSQTSQGSGISGFVVLAAEVDLRGRAPRVVRIPLDGSLRGKPVGTALRVSTFPSRFGEEPGYVRMLQGLTREVAAEARTKGIALSEIQIDYDCPESKLDDYRDLLPKLRKAAAPVPLTFTALPSWMGQRRAFSRLIGAADGYVLQVHSLRAPADPGSEFHLIQPREARDWIEQAARFGRPFRVALPTYSYVAAFDPRGKLLGLSAEGPLLSWLAGVRLRTVRSDPADLAELVRGWTRERPGELAGILWYRLPVEGDRMNWSIPALRAVMAGRTPRGAVRSAVREPEPGLVEIGLVNDGEDEAATPASVSVGWSGEAFLAADGLAGYRATPKRNGLRLRGSGRLRPGERRTIAWMRFATRTEVHIEIQNP